MRAPTALLSLLLAFAAAAAAHAAEPPADPSQPATPVMDAAELEAASGGQGVSVEVLTRQQLQASTSGNTVSANTLTTGDVTFGPGALDGFSGVGNFVVNTGANNTLQGAINISIVGTPQP